ncbi:response regulator transcription factor [Melghirimyces algeriensis]|uniref:DNA-binding response regulator, OmpR family, contains REC and winged-helix (WHTH) domain n=1 Tax=Melghirimyces algeriensis TaxID=910412 RepID=A0A521AD01_9BACL|nr:response regulator transcription factor [Melghirimyces algeriensis]SMO32704.1 DNA-binding response regulator, OmpR family, contains REC and winged-helix (wHTH) domain [Melghirimyces algeriensis]
MSAKLLLVDDEEEILQLLKVVLTKEGFTDLHTASSATEALKKAQQLSPDLIILDVMLPDGEGFDLCQQMRRFSTVPILFLTARGNDLDKLMGLGIGGDDYITKPFNPLEVAARVKVHLRRQHQWAHAVTESAPVVHAFGPVRIIESEGKLEVNGQDVPCPAREFQLLTYLAKHPNRLFSKSQLYEYVWGEESMGDDNTVMVHIRRLREKIEPNPSQPRYLITVRGLGYKLVPSGDDKR